MAISMRLNTRRRIAVATTTRLPRCARNDKAGTHERRSRVDIAGGPRHNCATVRFAVIPRRLGIRAALHREAPRWEVEFCQI